MPNDKTSTLFSFEKSFRPITLSVTYISYGVAAALLACAASFMPLWSVLLAMLPSLLLAASNVRYQITHPLPTVGMVPLALFTLITPLMTFLCAPNLTGIVRGVFTALLLLLLALLAVFMFWAFRLRRVYSTHPQISPRAALIVLGGAIKRGKPCETLVQHGRAPLAAAEWPHHCSDRWPHARQAHHRSAGDGALSAAARRAKLVDDLGYARAQHPREHHVLY